MIQMSTTQISTCPILLGLGRTAPDPNASVTLDGVQVPLGKGVNTNIDDTSLLYNEYPLNKTLFIWISCIVTSISESQSLYRSSLFSPPSCALSITLIAFVFLNHLSSRYIVYDVAQINLKYLLKVRFNYQTSLW